MSKWQSSVAAERQRRDDCNKASRASIRECGALVTSRFSCPKLSNTGRKKPHRYSYRERDDARPFKCDHPCTVSAPHSLTRVMTEATVTILVSFRAEEGCATFSSTPHFCTPTVTQGSSVCRQALFFVGFVKQHRKRNRSRWRHTKPLLNHMCKEIVASPKTAALRSLGGSVIVRRRESSTSNKNGVPTGARKNGNLSFDLRPLPDRMPNHALKPASCIENRQFGYQYILQPLKAQCMHSIREMP